MEPLNFIGVLSLKQSSRAIEILSVLILIILKSQY
jgi:hypothetical protein